MMYCHCRDEEKAGNEYTIHNFCMLHIRPAHMILY